MIRIRSLVLTLTLVAPAAALAADTVPPAILAERAQPPAPGQPLVIEAEIFDDSEIFEPTVYWREAGSANYEPVSMTGEAPLFRAEFLPPDGAEAVEYFIEAYDIEGNGPSRYGAPQAPVRVVLPARPAVAEKKDVPRAVAAKPKEKPAAQPAPVQEEVARSSPTRTPQATLPPQATEPVAPAPRAPGQWRRPAALGLFAAGVLLAGGGIASSLIARRDAATFNQRFNDEGRFDQAEYDSILGLANTGGGLLGASLLSISAGGTLLLVEF